MIAKRITSRVGGKSRMLPKAEPYFDLKTRSTKYSTRGDVYNMQMPKMAKRK